MKRAGKRNGMMLRKGERRKEKERLWCARKEDTQQKPEMMTIAARQKERLIAYNANV